MSHDELMARASFLGVFKELMFMYCVVWLLLYALASLPVLLVAAGLLVRKRGPWFVPLATPDPPDLFEGTGRNGTGCDEA